MQKSKTQEGILGILENYVRKFPLVYYFVRKIIIKFNIFEEDFKILKKIFGHNKINIIDIGASDGISANFFYKNLNVNKIYCFEPHKTFLKNLNKLKKKYSNLIINDYGISNKKEDLYVYVPYLNCFGYNLELLTYTFYNKKELLDQIKLDFISYNKIKIKKIKLKLRKFKVVKRKIDLIKLDVNGYELEIVKSLLIQIKKDKPLLIIENNSKINEISAMLTRFGYKSFCNINNSLVKYSNQKVLDIFFIKK